VKEYLAPNALFVLDFLEKHPKGVYESTITKKLKSKGFETQHVLPELRKQKYIRRFCSSKKNGKKFQRKCLYTLNSLLTLNMKGYMTYLRDFPFVAKSSLLKIKKAEELERQALTLLKLRKKVKQKNIPRDSTQQKMISIISCTESTRPKNAKNMLNKQALFETESCTEVFMYPLLTRRKNASFLVETSLKFLPVVNVRFLNYLEKITKAKQEPFAIDFLRDIVSKACGVEYPREIIIAACRLGETSGRHLNVSFTFGDKPECQHANIEKKFRTISPGEVEPYKQCSDCGKINP